MLERKNRKNATDITFVLPEGVPPGPVSVVGTFNDWRPGTHVLEPRPDGTRAVTVALPHEDQPQLPLPRRGGLLVQRRGSRRARGSQQPSGHLIAR